MATGASTGDVAGKVARVCREMQQLKCTSQVDEVGLRLGDPVAFLPLLHFVLLKFSRHVAQCILKAGYELQGKTDQKFVENAFKLFRDTFNIKTVLTPSQFLDQGFAERKLLLVSDVVQACKKIHNDEIRKERLAALKARPGTSAETRLYEPTRKTPEVKVVRAGHEVRQVPAPQHLPNATDAAQSVYKVRKQVLSPATSHGAHNTGPSSAGRGRAAAGVAAAAAPSPSGSATGTMAPMAWGGFGFATSAAAPAAGSATATPMGATLSGGLGALSTPIHSWFVNPTFGDTTPMHDTTRATWQQQQQQLQEQADALASDANPWTAPWTSSSWWASDANGGSQQEQQPAAQQQAALRSSFGFPAAAALSEQQSPQPQQQWGVTSSWLQGAGQQAALAEGDDAAGDQGWGHAPQHARASAAAAQGVHGFGYGHDHSGSPDEGGDEQADAENSGDGEDADAFGYGNYPNRYGFEPVAALDETLPTIHEGEEEEGSGTGLGNSLIHRQQGVGYAAASISTAGAARSSFGYGAQSAYSSIHAPGAAPGAPAAFHPHSQAEIQPHQQQQQQQQSHQHHRQVQAPAPQHPGHQQQPQQHPTPAASHPQPSGPTSHELDSKLWAVERQLMQQLAELQAKMQAAEEAAEKARVEYKQSNEALQARVTVLEGRVRFLECELDGCVRRGDYHPPLMQAASSPTRRVPKVGSSPASSPAAQPPAADGVLMSSSAAGGAGSYGHGHQQQQLHQLYGSSASASQGSGLGASVANPTSSLNNMRSSQSHHQQQQQQQPAGSAATQPAASLFAQPSLAQGAAGAYGNNSYSSLPSTSGAQQQVFPPRSIPPTHPQPVAPSASMTAPSPSFSFQPSAARQQLSSSTTHGGPSPRSAGTGALQPQQPGSASYAPPADAAALNLALPPPLPWQSSATSLSAPTPPAPLSLPQSVSPTQQEIDVSPGGSKAHNGNAAPPAAAAGSTSLSYRSAGGAPAATGGNAGSSGGGAYSSTSDLINSLVSRYTAAADFLNELKRK